ncbi:hypothetical protein ACFCY8_11340 [Streptomyces noursei]|uniref:beta barrel domain-containing protein n=1 Tax=Streptomyces noursei TaxID=1971 RepID=UPI0035DF3741
MTTESLQGVKVGDELVLVAGNRFRGDEPVIVSRVGTKYVYVTLHGRECREQFDRKTGVEVDQRGVRARLLTPAQYEEMAQRRKLFARLLGAGIEVRHGKRAELSTDQLRALLAVVQGEAAGSAGGE